MNRIVEARVKPGGATRKTHVVFDIARRLEVTRMTIWRWLAGARSACERDRLALYYCQFAPGTKLTIFYDLEKGEKDREAAWLHAELLQGWPPCSQKFSRQRKTRKNRPAASRLRGDSASGLFVSQKKLPQFVVRREKHLTLVEPADFRAGRSGGGARKSRRQGDVQQSAASGRSSSRPDFSR